MAYYAFINKIKPSKILEIGSGFSSLIALEALKKLGRGKLICLEPFPRKFITRLSNEKEIELLGMSAQKLDVSMINSLLNDGDIL
jgi:predicted O-methyltransferase YrrM